MLPWILGTLAVAGLNRVVLMGRGHAELFFKDHVHPVEGSVVSCHLAGFWDHTGIYVGDGRIVHRDGEGYISEVTPSEFLARLGGYNPAVSIFVSCLEEIPIGDSAIAQRARDAVGRKRFGGDHLIEKNCHAFTQYCITGNIDNGILDCTLTGVEQTASEFMGMDNWRTWEWSDMERYG